MSFCWSRLAVFAHDNDEKEKQSLLSQQSFARASGHPCTVVVGCGGPEGETPRTATCPTRPPSVSPLLTSARALARTSGSGFVVFLLVLNTQE